MPDPWERLEDEPKNAYDAFLVYRDLGPSRTIAAAYGAFVRMRKGRSGRPPKRPSGQWQAWSVKFDWGDRVEAWDDQITEKVVPTIEDVIASSPQATGIPVRVSEIISEYLERMARLGDVADIALTKAEKLLGLPIMRMSDERLEQQASGQTLTIRTFEPANDRYFQAAAALLRAVADVQQKAGRDILALRLNRRNPLLDETPNGDGIDDGPPRLIINLHAGNDSQSDSEAD